MNSKKSFERKITIQSSDQSETNLCSELKSPLNRIVSRKWLSFKDIPFSQHIFWQEPTHELKVSSAKSFNPEGWNFEPKWDSSEKQSEVRKGQKGSKNTENSFLQAKSAYVNKQKEKKGLVKRKSVIEQVDHGMIDDAVSYRTIKKNERLAQIAEQVKTLI